MFYIAVGCGPNEIRIPISVSDNQERITSVIKNILGVEPKILDGNIIKFKIPNEWYGKYSGYIEITTSEDEILVIPETEKENYKLKTVEQTVFDSSTRKTTEIEFECCSQIPIIDYKMMKLFSCYYGGCGECTSIEIIPIEDCQLGVFTFDLD